MRAQRLHRLFPVFEDCRLQGVEAPAVNGHCGRRVHEAHGANQSGVARRECGGDATTEPVTRVREAITVCYNRKKRFCMTKCKGPHHDLDDFTTYDLRHDFHDFHDL
jgi:hypothetical protein